MIIAVAALVGFCCVLLLLLIHALDVRDAVRRHCREVARGDAEWRSERAMQAGMAFGVDGYNDEMGW